MLISAKTLLSKYSLFQMIHKLYDFHLCKGSNFMFTVSPLNLHLTTILLFQTCELNLTSKEKYLEKKKKEALVRNRL